VIANRSPDNSFGGQFVNAILPRLSVFHINSCFDFKPEVVHPEEELPEDRFSIKFAKKQAECYYFNAEIYPKLRQLSCKCDKIISKVKDFPNLTTLRLHRLALGSDLRSLNTSALHSLKFLRFIDVLRTDRMLYLNRLPSIEKLQCVPDSNLVANQSNPNSTVKHLLFYTRRPVTSEMGYNRSTIQYSDYRVHFTALETIDFVQVPGTFNI